MRNKILIILLLFVQIIHAQNPKREFRGVWVATVNNIDWPSKSGLTSEQQMQEISAILDMHKANGMNAIIFQVRPAADAFYPSSLEPWSRYLTGEPGKAPDPYYDPLQEWIDRTHKRGMEFHAWCNPYRVSQNADQPLAGNHIAFKHPDWILKYGNKLYFDPGHPDVREFVRSVISDMVSRYDIDAIHFDDYFYPYRIQGEEFPDTASFRLYNFEGYADINDWRRNNVDTIIKMLSETIKKNKPWVKFGISPFGVWRNKKNDSRGSETSAGQTNYDDLYADILKWEQEGWIDYLVPQLYWRIGHPLVDFETLCDWWGNNSFGKDIYIGQAAYKINPNSKFDAWNKSGEIGKQIDYLRNNKNISGSVFFSSKSFNGDLLGLQNELQEKHYSTPAIVPSILSIDSQPSSTPKLKRGFGKKVKWRNRRADDEQDKVVRMVVYMNKKGEVFNSDDSRFIFDLVTGEKLRFVRNKGKKQKYEIRVSALDRNNNESKISKPVIMKL